MQFPFLRGVAHGTAADSSDFPADDVRLYTRLFWTWIILRTLVWTAIACLTMFNLPLDTAEMLSWGREWQWGYHKHPPMPAWIAEISMILSGGSIYGVYLAAHVVTAICFWGVWRLSCEMLSPRASFFAALSLEGLVYYNFMANDIGHGVLLAGTSAITTVVFYWTLRHRTMGWWLTLGVAMGATMLSKYSSGFLLLPMILFLFHPSCRSCWKSPGPYLAAAVALAIFTPHLISCAQNHWGPIRYILHRSSENGHSWIGHLYFPLYFAFSQLWRLLPIFLILAPLTTCTWRLRRLAPEESFNRDFLLAIVLGPFLMHLLVSLLFGVEVHDLWGHHLWSFIGLLILFFMKTRESAWTFAWSGRLALGVSALFLAFTIGQNLLGAKLGTICQTHFPGQPIARAVDEEWHQHFPGKVPIVASNELFLMASVSWYIPGRPATCMLQGNHETPWAEDRELNKSGGVILWETRGGGNEMPANLRDRFPRAMTVAPVEARHHTINNLPPLRIGVALVPPETY